MSAKARTADSIAVPPPTRDMAQSLKNITEYGYRTQGLGLVNGASPA